MDYKKILVPVDGSDHSLTAIDHAVALAKITGGKVDLVNVVDIAERVQIYTQFHAVYVPENYLNDLLALGDQVIIEALTHLPDDVKGEVAVKTGEPREFLRDYIENREYDLVVMGNRGLGSLSGLVLGSVGQFLIHNAPCPVMIVK